VAFLDCQEKDYILNNCLGLYTAWACLHGSLVAATQCHEDYLVNTEKERILSPGPALEKTWTTERSCCKNSLDHRGRI